MLGHLAGQDRQRHALKKLLRDYRGGGGTCTCTVPYADAAVAVAVGDANVICRLRLVIVVVGRDTIVGPLLRAISEGDVAELELVCERQSNRYVCVSIERGGVVVVVEVVVVYRT